MSKIRSKNTKPELILRSALHKLGYRFRIHGKDLPGKPDIVLKKYNSVIFVNGCFWHGHNSCTNWKMPSSNRNYWQEKIKKNKIRDEKIIQAIAESGWKVIVVWECELKPASKNKTLKDLLALLENRLTVIDKLN